jgi:hypothetical protein
MGTPQLEETGEDVTVALSYPPLGPENNPKYDDWPKLDQDKSRRYTMAAANGMEENADSDDYPVLARYVNPDIFDLSGIALGAFGLNGSASVLFEMAGQQPQTPYDEDLIKVVEDGLWGIANQMADGSVDEIDGDEFYDIPKYWPDEPSVSEPRQYATDFTDGEVGESPADWSPIWQGQEDQFTILDEPNRLQHITGSGVRGLTSDVVGEIFGSAEIFGIVRGNNVQGTLFELGFHMSGSATYENAIYADAQMPDENSDESTIRIMERNGGSTQTLASAELPFTLEEDDWYSVLLQRDADALRLKMWPDGEDEPEDWQVVVTQGNRYGGKVGISHSTPGAIIDYAFIGVGIGGLEAPRTPEDIPEPEDITADEIIAMVEQFAEEGEFESDEAVHSLVTHLRAVSRYEDQGEAEKIIRHMEGFQVLLNHYKDNELVSDEAYDLLIENSNKLIEKWRRDVQETATAEIA